MNINPTYTPKQYWLTTILSGVTLSILLCAVYIFLCNRLYVESSFIFSILYIVPLVWIGITVSFFKLKFVYSEYTYKQAFLMGFLIGIIGSILFSGVIYEMYTLSVVESRMEIIRDASEMKKFLSPAATALSLLVVNLFFSFLYSIIVAAFAKKN